MVKNKGKDQSKSWPKGCRKAM